MKPWPTLNSDDEAEAFVAEADLTEYDPAQMVPMRFEWAGPGQGDGIPLPGPLLAAARDEAARRGMTLAAFVRMAIERALPAG